MGALVFSNGQLCPLAEVLKYQHTISLSTMKRLSEQTRGGGLDLTQKSSEELSGLQSMHERLRGGVHHVEIVHKVGAPVG